MTGVMFNGESVSEFDTMPKERIMDWNPVWLLSRVNVCPCSKLRESHPFNTLVGDDPNRRFRAGESFPGTACQ